jgi:ribosomal protein S18 acetylase RimI-like enzyme
VTDLATTITVAGRESVDRLEELWVSLSRHHAAVAPELEGVFGPVRPEGDSWAERRALYEEWLAEPDGFALIAESDARPVGYAVVSARAPEETWSSGRVAELQTLAVLPEHRGHGIGTKLVERMHEELVRRDIGHFTVAVIASNTDAVRFYERLGLTPFLTTYAGRVSG